MESSVVNGEYSGRLVLAADKVFWKQVLYRLLLNCIVLLVIFSLFTD